MTETGEGRSDIGPDASGRTGPPVGDETQQAPNEGAAIPPYEGRTESAPTENDPEERKRRWEGVGEGARTGEVTDPEATPGGRTAAPADERPAAEQEETRPSDPGVGPAHTPGTSRGEDVASQEDEAGRDTTGTKGQSQRPHGESSGRDVSSVNPQDE